MFLRLFDLTLYGGSVLKRSIDVFFAVTMLIVCIPLLVACAVLIRIESEGPVLFRQLRMGRDSRLFEILKLRTMRVGEPGPEFTLGPDLRITRMGAWLRRWKLDELPQLWNVIRGDMSLVGPRPVVPAVALAFASEYAYLLKGRPGLTDPASIKYCDEAGILAFVPDALEYFHTVLTPEKLRISRDYLERATVLTDLQVIVRTALVLLIPARRRGSSSGSEKLHPRLSPPSLSRD